MTPSIRQAIGRAFPLNGADFEVDDAQRRTSGVRDAVSDPLFTGMEMSDGAIDRLVELQPAIADRLTALQQAYRGAVNRRQSRSEEHTSELPSLMRTSSAVFCLQKPQTHPPHIPSHTRPQHTTPSHTHILISTYQ